MLFATVETIVSPTEVMLRTLMYLGFPGSSNSKVSAWVQSLHQEDSLEKEMATHSSILAWKIPWAEEPGELQSMGCQRVGHD